MGNRETSTLKIPGIFLEKIAPQHKHELLTGVPLFLGLASPKKSSDKPRRLTLKTHFNQYFKEDQEEGYLRDAVRGFFENGGSLCYVFAMTENTVEDLQDGLLKSETIDDIDLVCAPDIMIDSAPEKIPMQQELLEHCKCMGDRFAILDALKIDDDTEIKKLDQQRQELSRHVSSHNGALYAPWIKIENLIDPKKPKSIPPCGHIAGIYASRDRAVGVHGAPANIALEEVLDLSLALTPKQQAELNPENEPGVNCLRSFRGRGIRVWGVRTLSPLAEWQYVNVRRLFLTFGRWVNLNLADTVFEPNSFPLWVRIQRELSVYCESLWRQGALRGAVPQEAFYVKCDEETNPSENREVGQVVAEVGLAPAIPGEFIQLLLVQTSSGITVT